MCGYLLQSLAGFLGGDAACPGAVIYCRLSARHSWWGEVFLPPRPNSLQFSRSWGWSQRPLVKRQMLSGQKNLLNSCQLVTNYYLKSFSPNSHLASLRCPRKTWKDRRVRSLIFSPFPDTLSPADPQSCPTNTPVSSPNRSAFPVPRAGGLLAAFSGTWLHALGQGGGRCCLPVKQRRSQAQEGPWTQGTGPRWGEDPLSPCPQPLHHSASTKNRHYSSEGRKISFFLDAF